MIAGFIDPTAGTIEMNGQLLSSPAGALPPEKRQMSMIFQSYAVWPNMTGQQNVAFGLELRKLPREEVRRRVGEMLEVVHMGHLAARYPAELSGGQQQRVALARAIAPEPPILLLDEPLSNLDAALRERTRTELRALLKRLGMTAVFVTHDQEEAFALSDRIAVMERGHLRQLATPEELYAAPATPFVAAFLGRANFLPATIVGEAPGGLACRLEAGPTWTARPSGGVGTAAGTEVRLMVRPEGLALTDSADSLAGTVTDRRFAGAQTFYSLSTEGGTELVVQGTSGDAGVGDTVRVAPVPVATVLAFPRAE
jgi:iron(III) transport system ATP-binding protein